MNDRQNEIKAIIAELEQETGTESANGLDPMARIMMQYYNALIEAGFEVNVAVALLLQWHMLMWARAFAVGGNSVPK